MTDQLITSDSYAPLVEYWLREAAIDSGRRWVWPASYRWARLQNTLAEAASYQQDKSIAANSQTSPGASP